MKVLAKVWFKIKDGKKYYSSNSASASMGLDRERERGKERDRMRERESRREREKGRDGKRVLVSMKERSEKR